MKIVRLVMQIALLCGISMLGNAIASWLQIGLPGNMIGLLLLFFLLERKVVSMNWIETGANFLIAELLLFFIPSAIGIVQFQDSLGNEWLPLLFVIGASTVIVLCFVAFATELVLRLKAAKERV